MDTPRTHLFVLTGASRGMGLAMAQQLLAAGHTVVCMSRKTESSLDTWASSHKATVVQWSQDLSDSAGASHRLSAWLVGTQEAQWASATLINNAGVIPALVPLREAQADDLAHALRVGLEAPMALCAAFLQATSTWQVPRKILNVSSGLGRRAMASQAAYCAAKAGMDHFTRCLALDEALLPNGAKVCSLAPGVIDTDMQVQLRGADAAHFPDRASFEGLHSHGQLSSPADAAKKVLAYLARADFGAHAVGDVRD
ncbi:SDR family NAD(P)-dependent oxidoreductase [Rhodoferax aquaticus]|uniref:SDR family NAD(P)-dependent oxidoreductase n=1 Tax=Rhodoferax aquaticus TaxID=2527691 RepID=A0A515ER28_9BURK|nr:SDR family NAD(P)-dependent oxidoreductase [Rhodoferax aquaticus]QDL55119.1 SDR family NAD(P)-dependent oxidoreductase [Rhodoferax aquaticus]